MHDGSHLVDELIIVVVLVFWRLLVQYLLKANVSVIFPFFQTSGMKLNYKLDKVLTFPGLNNGFQFFIWEMLEELYIMDRSPWSTIAKDEFLILILIGWKIEVTIGLVMFDNVNMIWIDEDKLV